MSILSLESAWDTCPVELTLVLASEKTMKPHGGNRRRSF